MRSEAFMTLGEDAKNSGICSMFHSLYTFLPLCTTCAQERCAQCVRPNKACKRKSTLKLSLSKCRKHRCAQSFCGRDHETLGGSGDLEHRQNTSRERAAQKLRFVFTFSGVAGLGLGSKGQLKPPLAKPLNQTATLNTRILNRCSVWRLI